MLQQHLVWKYELNCEYCNITLARNKAPWWWSDKIETCHMLPQHLVCKYELNCEYCNINLARNKAPWWWSDKIETCRSVLKRLKELYVILHVHSLVNGSKWFYKKKNARCYNKIRISIFKPLHHRRNFVRQGGTNVTPKYFILKNSFFGS